MKKVLILGASGLLGSQLAPILRSFDFEVTASGYSNSAEPIVNCDATDFEELSKLIKKSDPDFVINLVALTSVDKCEVEIDLAYQLNTKVVENIAKAIQQNSAKKIRIIHVSTDHIYNKPSGFSEESEVSLLNVYSLSKYAGELALHGSDSVTLRTNFFGPGRVGTRKSFWDSIEDSLSSEQPFYGFIDSFFNPLSIDQLSIEICRVLKNWVPGVYNLGASTGMSKFAFARLVASQLGLDSNLIRERRITSVPNLVPRPSNMTMNVEAYQRTFNVQLPSLESLIKKSKECQIVKY